jgi:hypothetical protein
LTGLVKKIDEQLETAGKYPRGLGVYVLFDSQAAGLDKDLIGIAEEQSLQRVSLCVGGPPEDYQISKDADVTVVVYNVARRGQQKVVANFALRKGELDAAKSDAIVKAIADVLPK